MNDDGGPARKVPVIGICEDGVYRPLGNKKPFPHFVEGFMTIRDAEGNVTGYVPIEDEP